MGYRALRDTQEVPYSGRTNGPGEARFEHVDTKHMSHAELAEYLQRNGNGLEVVERRYTSWDDADCRGVPYSGSETVVVTIDVEDDPFNNKVEETSGSVDAVSGTVGIFQSEQIQQVSQSAIEIARSLENGFASVVSAEISQQIGVMEERSKNAFQLLQTYKVRMNKILQTMEKDYFDIKSRNIKQFDSINKQYTEMIHSLDAASFAMSKDLEASMQSYAELAVATQALLPEESSRTRNNLEVNQLNGTSDEIICGISNLLRQNNAYNAFVQDKISNVSAEGEELQCLPVLYFESDALKNGSVETNCFMHLDDYTVKKNIEESVKSALHGQAAVIENDYQENFQQKMDVANLSERESNVIRSLMNDNGI